MDSSMKLKSFYSIHCLWIVTHLLSTFVDGSVLPLSRDDLREKYGQGTLQVKNNFLLIKFMQETIFSSRYNFQRWSEL